MGIVNPKNPAWILCTPLFSLLPSMQSNHPARGVVPGSRFVLGITFALFALAPLCVAFAGAANLQGEDARDRAFAVRALGEAGGADAVASLAVALGDANVFVRATAMQALHDLGCGPLRQAVIMALEGALTGDNPLARAGAAETLGMLKAENVAEALTRLLEDQHARAQHAAACALARVNAKDAAPELIALARAAGAGPFARMGAVWALGELKIEQAVAPLLEVIEEGRRGEWNYTSVAVYAVEALGKINAPASLPRLVSAMSIKDRHLRAQLAVTLSTMTGHDFGQDQEKWKTFLSSGS